MKWLWFLLVAGFRAEAQTSSILIPDWWFFDRQPDERASMCASAMPKNYDFIACGFVEWYGVKQLKSGRIEYYNSGESWNWNLSWDHGGATGMTEDRLDFGMNRVVKKLQLGLNASMYRSSWRGGETLLRPGMSAQMRLTCSETAGIISLLSIHRTGSHYLGFYYTPAPAFYAVAGLIHDAGRRSFIQGTLTSYFNERLRFSLGYRSGNRGVEIRAGYSLRNFLMDVSFTWHSQLGISPVVTSQYNLAK